MKTSPHAKRVVLLAALVTLLGLPAAPVVPQAHAGPMVVGPPATALLVVIAYRGQREVKSWIGPIDWAHPLPARFSAQRQGRSWHWSELIAATISMDSDHRKSGGTPLSQWADRHRADRLDILLIAHPGARDADAGNQGRGTTGQGTGGDRKSASRAAERGQREGDTEAISDRGVERGARTGQLDGYQATEHQPGLGKRVGDGQFRGDGFHAERAGDGHDLGQERGHADGSSDPSWHVAETGDRVRVDGGRVGHVQGREHGGAGGEPGADGHIYGSGWIAILDAPESVAAAVNVAIIALDANITGVGDKLFQRAVRGLLRSRLRRAIRAEIDQVVERAVRDVQRDVKRTHGFGPLAETHKARLLQDLEDQFPGQAYGRLQRHAETRAREYEEAVARLADATSTVEQRGRELCQKNASAYRAIEASAAEAGRNAVMAGFRKRQQEFVAGYRRLNPHSGLSDQEILDYQRLGYEYRPDTGALFHPEAGKYPAPVDPNRAVYKPSRDPEFTAYWYLTHTDANAMERLRKARKAASDELDALHRREGVYASMGEPARQEALRAQRATMRDASHDLGELAGKAYAAKELRPKGFEALALPTHKANNFDQVYYNAKTGEVVIIECKGGAGRLGSRFGEQSQRVQQGARSYLEAVLGDLFKTKRGTASKIEKALRDKKVRYLEARQGIKGDGSLEKVVTKEFDINQ